MITSGDLHLFIFIPVRIYTCADLHLCGYTPVWIYTCADLHLRGFTSHADLHLPRKTPARFSSMTALTFEQLMTDLPGMGLGWVVLHCHSPWVLEPRALQVCPSVLATEGGECLLCSRSGKLGPHKENPALCHGCDGCTWRGSFSKQTNKQLNKNIIVTIKKKFLSILENSLHFFRDFSKVSFDD